MALPASEMQVEITNSEIQEDKRFLGRQADKRSSDKYDNMKTRIKYMYETGSCHHFWEMLFSAEDMTDFLNKADFIQNISDYDRKMLLELQETKKQIEQEEETLHAQQDSLLTSILFSDKKQADLVEKANATFTDLSAFQAQLQALRAKKKLQILPHSSKNNNPADKPSTETGGTITLGQVRLLHHLLESNDGGIIQGGGSDASLERTDYICSPSWIARRSMITMQCWLLPQ